jgi:hypothetical protein
VSESESGRSPANGKKSNYEREARLFGYTEKGSYLAPSSGTRFIFTLIRSIVISIPLLDCKGGPWIVPFFVPAYSESE